MEKTKKQMESKDDVLIIDGITITSNINEEGVREHLTKSLCELTKEFNKKYKNCNK